MAKCAHTIPHRFEAISVWIATDTFASEREGGCPGLHVPFGRETGITGQADRGAHDVLW